MTKSETTFILMLNDKNFLGIPVMEEFLIGVDFGATNIKIGIITPKGELLQKYQYPTESFREGTFLIEGLVLKLNVIIEENLKKFNKLIGIGIGVAGPIDIKKGVMIEPPNLPNLRYFNLRDFLEHRLPYPIVIENDGNAFALGEGWVGSAKDCKNYCGITLGTGVGGGIVIGGKILHGASGMAGEVGHMVIDPNGPLCGCGAKGCLEVYASAQAIRRMAIEAIEKGIGKGILRYTEKTKPGALEAEHVFDAATEGDPVAREIFIKMGMILGLGISNLINLFNPEKIVIGGKVSRAWEFFINSVKHVVNERAMKGPKEIVKIVRASHIDDAGILGAAYTLLNR